MVYPILRWAHESRLAINMLLLHRFVWLVASRDNDVRLPYLKPIYN